MNVPDLQKEPATWRVFMLLQNSMSKREAAKYVSDMLHEQAERIRADVANDSAYRPKYNAGRLAAADKIDPEVSDV